MKMVLTIRVTKMTWKLVATLSRTTHVSFCQALVSDCASFTSGSGRCPQATSAPAQKLSTLERQSLSQNTHCLADSRIQSIRNQNWYHSMLQCWVAMPLRFVARPPIKDNMELLIHFNFKCHLWHRLCISIQDRGKNRSKKSWSKMTKVINAAHT